MPPTAEAGQASSSRITLCPYCLRPLADVPEVSNEHLVPFALGGLETVPACKVCNETIGHGLEGRLLGPTSWLTVVAQAAGFTRGWTNVTLAGGQQAVEHFGSRQGMVLEPKVEIVEQNADRLTLGLTIPPHIGQQFVDYIISQQSGRVEKIEHNTPPPQWATANLSVNVDDLASLSAKVALCTGAMRWGDAFLLSDLGDWCRRGVSDPAVLHEFGPPAMPGIDAINNLLQTVVAHYTTTNGSTPWRSPVPSMTILTPVDAGKATVIVLALFGVPLVTFGCNFAKPGLIQPAIHFHPFRDPATTR